MTLLKLHPILVALAVAPFARAQLFAKADVPIIPATQAWVVDASKLDPNSDEFLATVSLQGLANRKGPQVFLFTGDQNWVATFKRPGISHSPETLAKYRSTDDAWQDYYQQHKGIQFQNLAGFDALFEKYVGLATGVAIYDPQKALQWVPAMALASACDLLPVTDELVKKHAGLAALPVRYDLRRRTESPFRLQQWVWEEVGAHCSKDGVYSIGGNIADRFAMDIVMARKMFVYRLNADVRKAPEEFAMIQTILKSLHPLSPAWGWGFPTESLLRDAASRAGAFVMCSEVPNISFHAQVKPGPTPFKPAVELPDPRKIPLEDKFYIAFLVNEGDTMKCAATMESFGMWLEPQRGQIAINWGVSPWIYDHFPALMEFYYQTMSPKDAFFSACSGYGYFTPGYSPSIHVAAQKESTIAHRAGLRLACSWAAQTLGPEEKVADWLDERGLDGFVREDGKALRLTFTKQNRPIISTDWKLFYPKERFGKPKDPEQQIHLEVEFLKALEQKMAPPVLIPIYGGDPAHFAKVAANLPADKFKVITVNEMVELGRKIGRLQILGDTLLVLPLAAGEKLAATGSIHQARIQVKLAVRNMSDTPQRGQISVRVPARWLATRVVTQYSELPAGTGSAIVEFAIAPASKPEAGDYDIIFTDSATKATARLKVKVTEASDVQTAVPVPASASK